MTSSGYTLQPSITIPTLGASSTIGVDGIVSVVLAGETDPIQVGTLQLTDFVNPAGLQPRGENLYVETVVERSAAARHPGTERFGHAAARRARNLERQRGRGARER